MTPENDNWYKLDNVSNVSCEKGLCKIESCKTGYHLNHDESGCDADTDLICGVDKLNCADIKNAENAKCMDGVCRFDCMMGFEKNGQSCVAVLCSDGEIMIEELESCMKCDSYPKGVDSENKYLLSEAKIYSNDASCLLDNLDIVSTVEGAKVQFNQLKYMRNSLLVSYSGENARLPKELSFPKLEHLERIEITGRARDPFSLILSSLVESKVSFH